MLQYRGAARGTVSRSRAMAFRAPLLGYNTNVRHKGRLYHIQTEDSGVGHPHIITHLFADGGRIVGSKKTSYVEHLGSDGLQDTVKKLMQGQHKSMFIAARRRVDEGPAEPVAEPWQHPGRGRADQPPPDTPSLAVRRAERAPRLPGPRARSASQPA